MWVTWIEKGGAYPVMIRPRKFHYKSLAIARARIASKFSVCLGIGLFIASLPSESILGIIGAVSLIIIGTVGCIETEA